MKRYFLVDVSYRNENGSWNKTGPFTPEELRRQGLTDDTIVWHEGLQEAAEAKFIPELAEFAAIGHQHVYCSDASIAAICALNYKDATWRLFGVSEVIAMGWADYKIQLFDFVFSDLIAFNSFNKTAYVCLKKDLKWGLLELKDNGTIQCEWKLIADFTYTTAEEMLVDFKLDKSSFHQW